MQTGHQLYLSCLALKRVMPEETRSAQFSSFLLVSLKNVGRSRPLACGVSFFAPYFPVLQVVLHDVWCSWYDVKKQRRGYWVCRSCWFLRREWWTGEGTLLVVAENHLVLGDRFDQSRS